ncbi:aspartyl protease family protein At5g10770-like [Cornus florida]|uniref:aspartyl protease family protein At5g10770-like n=1 Tax=Cornus florida TaxID=4283 RepID=UPI00289DF22B|nr:aspartyl protease family protein At5g10770-like [Cornus florida]
MSVYAALRDEFAKIMSSKHEIAPSFEFLDTCYKGSLKDMLDVPEEKWGWLGSSFLATSTFAGNQEDEQGLNHSALRFTLHHVHGHGSPLTSQSPLSFSDLLSRDQARVTHLNSRLTKNITSSVTENLFGSNLVTTPVNSDTSVGVGRYYIKVGLGTPPTYYPVIVDTGSYISWVQCKPCEVYCHPQVVPYFDPSASSTYKRLSCTTPECNSLNRRGCTSSDECLYEVIYEDKSYTVGYLSQDSLSLSPSETLPGFVFGCGQNNNGTFAGSGGLFGLGRNKLSMVSQLSTKYGNGFSYCLPTASGGSGGSLSIGRDSLTGPPYKFTPMLPIQQETGYYFLKLSAIVVAGRTLQGVSEADYNIPTILDSGTTLTYLHPSVYAALRDEFKKILSTKHEALPSSSYACYKGSMKELSTDVPEIRLVFEGEAELTLASQNILFDGRGITCLAFGTLDPNLAVVGYTQQQTYGVAYDVSNSRIGFAAGGCS